MKLSFSIPSKSSSKTNSSSKQDPTNPSKHFLTQFDPSTHTEKEAKIVIPPIQNQWRPLKKMKNLELPITEQQTPNSPEPGSNGNSYGLNLRHPTKKNNDNDGSEKKSDDVDDDDDRLWHRTPAPSEPVLLQRLKDDLNSLPEDQGFDEFKDVPVEGFGAALLAGYGWSEGMGIGKNAKEDVKVVQYQRRTAKEGLGFVSDDRMKWKKEEEERDGKTKENGRDFVGKSVRIVDAGLKGSVLRRIGDNWVVLKLSTSGEEVKVRLDDVVEFDSSVEEESYVRKLKEVRIQRDAKDKCGRGGHGEVEEMRVDIINGGHRKEDVSWLTSHIRVRVRVISRDFKGGRLYLKKGEVLDVVGPTTCDIAMDESKEIIQGVSQDLLETGIPRCGGPVHVLYGKHKGAYGSLVERDLDQGIGIVKDADSHELLNVKLEHIAEYIGDPSLLGH